MRLASQIQDWPINLLIIIITKLKQLQPLSERTQKIRE